jgi:hypothetical protein
VKARSRAATSLCSGEVGPARVPVIPRMPPIKRIEMRTGFASAAPATRSSDRMTDQVTENREGQSEKRCRRKLNPKVVQCPRIHDWLPWTSFPSDRVDAATVTFVARQTYTGEIGEKLRSRKPQIR